MELKKYSAVILIFMVFLGGCLNKYEKEILGEYEIREYQLIDSVKILPEKLPQLIFRKDKTYTLILNNKTVTGKWFADDYGDWTLIKLNYNEKEIVGQILKEGTISFWNPFQLDCAFLKTIEFRRKTSAN